MGLITGILGKATSLIGSGMFQGSNTGIFGGKLKNFIQNVKSGGPTAAPPATTTTASDKGVNVGVNYSQGEGDASGSKMDVKTIMKWVGIGFGCLTVIGLVIWAIRRGSSSPKRRN